MKELRDIWDWLQEAKRQNIKGPELKERPKIRLQAGTDLPTSADGRKAIFQFMSCGMCYFGPCNKTEKTS